MGQWKLWSSPAAAAALILLGLFGLDWWAFSSEFGRVSVDLRGAQLCLGPFGCNEIPMRQLGGSFGLFARITFAVGLVSAGGLAWVAALRATTGNADVPFARAIGAACALLLASAILTLFAFPPDNAAEGLGRGGWATVGGALLGVIAVYYVGAGRDAYGEGRAEPIRVVPAPLTPPAATPPRSVYDYEAVGRRARRDSTGTTKTGRVTPAGPAAVDALREALRFVVNEGAIGAVGLDVRLDRGGYRTVRWSEIRCVVARRLPPDPPYEKAIFVDLITDAGPLRLLPSSRLDYHALPGGAAPNSRENLRRLVALAHQHNPRLVLDAQSADFFRGGREPPMFTALKKFAEYDTQYG